MGGIILIFETSSTKKIAKTYSGKYFKKNSINSWFFYEDLDLRISINSSLKRNRYQILQPIVKTNFINGYEISKDYSNRLVQTGRLTNRFGASVGNISILLFCGWIGYLYSVGSIS